MTNQIYDLFPGGNTPNGFYSFYHYVLPLNEANKIYYLKGGPGTGKSTIMKKVSAHFNALGYDVEHHHCSSDPDSLDGVVIRKLNIAIIDGTSPHLIDPKIPGAIDEIINLGENWDEEGIVKNKEAIIKTSTILASTFKKAYGYLSAAKSIHDNLDSYYLKNLNPNEVLNLETNLAKNLFLTPYSQLGKERHLFLTAFTPKGVVTFVDDMINKYQNVIILKTPSLSLIQSTMNYLKDEAIKRNYNVEIYHDPLIVDRIEHLVIPKLNLALISENEVNQKQFELKKIDFNDFLNQEMLDDQKLEIGEDRQLFYQLLNKGLLTLTKAKKLHDDLETYYVPNMDFTKTESLTTNLIKKMQKYHR